MRLQIESCAGSKPAAVHKGIRSSNRCMSEMIRRKLEYTDMPQQRDGVVTDIVAFDIANREQYKTFTKTITLSNHKLSVVQQYVSKDQVR